VPPTPLRRVEGVHRSDAHTFAKATLDRIELVAGLGVAGDAHAGATVRHRSRVRADPTQPNLRQVHLLPGELLDELLDAGYPVSPGRLGENVTTRGLDLLALPTGTLLRLGERALLSVTGLRNPCGQLNGVAPDLRQRLVELDADGEVVRRRAGVMAVVVEGGEVRPGDPIEVQHPPGPATPLAPV
jgi:hypothetical protein